MLHNSVLGVSTNYNLLTVSWVTRNIVLLKILSSFMKNEITSFPLIGKGDRLIQYWQKDIKCYWSMLLCHYSDSKCIACFCNKTKTCHRHRLWSTKHKTYSKPPHPVQINGHDWLSQLAELHTHSHCQLWLVQLTRSVIPAYANMPQAKTYDCWRTM